MNLRRKPKMAHRDLCFCSPTNPVLVSSPLQELIHAAYKDKAEKLTNHNKLYQSHVLHDFKV